MVFSGTDRYYLNPELREIVNISISLPFMCLRSVVTISGETDGDQAMAKGRRTGMVEWMDQH